MTASSSTPSNPPTKPARPDPWADLPQPAITAGPEPHNGDAFGEPRPARPDSPVVAELRASAGRVGVLRGPAATIANVIHEFAGTATFHQAGYLPRAAVVTIDATPGGLWDARISRPGQRERDAQIHVVSGPRPLAWVRDLVGGVRAPEPDLDLLVVLGDGCVPFLAWADLAQLAAEQRATIAVLDTSDAAVSWEPRPAAEPRPQPTTLTAPAPMPEPVVRSRGKAVSERELVDVARKLVDADYPESVTTATGHQLSVAYPRRGVAVFRAWTEHDGRLIELDVLSADDQRSLISEREFEIGHE